jgi:hypothetical protein
MHEWRSLSHVRWECKYHVVFIPKYPGQSHLIWRIGPGGPESWARFGRNMIATVRRRG